MHRKYQKQKISQQSKFNIFPLECENIPVEFSTGVQSRARKQVWKNSRRKCRSMLLLSTPYSQRRLLPLTCKTKSPQWLVPSYIALTHIASIFSFFGLDICLFKKYLYFQKEDFLILMCFKANISPLFLVVFVPLWPLNMCLLNK